MITIKYIEIKVKKWSFKESFEKTDLIGVTLFFSFYFKDSSIWLINDRETMGWQDDTSHSGFR